MSFLDIFKRKDEPIKSYKDFWDWFIKNEKQFFKVIKGNGDIENDFFDKISPKLNELKEGFFYLTGMFDSNTVELILTADGNLKNIFFVEQLVVAAPIINGWKFTALKPPSDIKDVNIKMAGYLFGSNNIYFYSNDHIKYPDEVDITVIHDDLTDENKADIVNGTFIFLDNFIGELEFVTTIDEIKIIGKKDAQKDLVPIEKLKSFLIWREAEFVEKYEGVRYDTENDNYATFKGKSKDGSVVFAIINTDLLHWESKASHPWILTVEIKFDGKETNGMPDDKTYKLLDVLEEEISEQLKDSDGYLNIGRETSENLREIYFACKDFRKPSDVLHNIQKKYLDALDLDYHIYKDKYWQSFNRFMNN